MAILLLLIPLITAAVFWTTNNRKHLNIINAIGSLIILIITIFVIKQVIDNKTITFSFFNNIIFIDSLSAIILMVISTISFIVCIYSIGYMNEEFKRKIVSLRKLKIYYTLLFVFIFTMLLTVSTQKRYYSP